MLKLKDKYVNLVNEAQKNGDFNRLTDRQKAVLTARFGLEDGVHRTTREVDAITGVNKSKNVIHEALGRLFKYANARD